MATKSEDLGGSDKLSMNTMESKKDISSSTQPHQPSQVDDVPDPEEDDLDDLDDMLDEFSVTKVDTKDDAPKASGPGRPIAPVENPVDNPLGIEGLTDDDFAKQLQAGMADLLGEMQNNPEMQSQFESMLKELGGASAFDEAAGLHSTSKAAKPATTTANNTVPSTVGEESFQETIKKTIERIQASGEQATAAAAANDSEDILAELMKQMQAGEPLGGEGSEEDFSKMLLGMMEQLTNKEILYEPMKELDDKFPDWIAKNKTKTAEDDMRRYEEQKIIVREIVAKFEEKTYADSNVADREYIVERMQRMQAAGSPPPDLVGDMASAQEALGAHEEGCPQQ